MCNVYIEQLNNTISNAMEEKQNQKRALKKIDKNKQIIEIQDYSMWMNV